MLTLKALDWSYDSDLGAPPGRWSCTYVESGSTAFLPGESTSQAAHKHVSIDIVIDGHAARLLDGVVRDFGINEDGDAVVSAAEGLDLKADLLDFRPTASATYQGMQILSDSTAPVPAGARKTVQIGSNTLGEPVIAAFFESFQTATRKVVEAAGYTASFDAYDYDLGEDVVWEPERSANDLLVQLASPFNATERFKLDIFVDANKVVRFIERGVSTPIQVTTGYERILRRTVRRSEFPAVNDVQVRGASYRYTEPDVPLGGGGAVPGQPSPDKKPYQISYRFEDWESEQNDIRYDPAVFGKTLVAETTGTHYFDADGRETKHVQWKVYYFDIVRNPEDGTWKGTFPRIRDESLSEEFVYSGPHGELTRRVTQKWVSDSTTYWKWNSTDAKLEIRGVAAMSGVLEQAEALYDFDARGNLTHSLTKVYQAEEKDDDSVSPAKIVLTGLVLMQAVEQFWSHSGGRWWRSTTTRNYGRDGRLRTISSHTEVKDKDATEGTWPTLYYQNASTGLVGSWQSTGGFVYAPYLWTMLQPKQYRPASAQVKAGPDHAQMKLVFEVLGTPTDCAYFRGKIQQERASTRYETVLDMLPDLELIEGRQLTVEDAPSRWETASMFITARHMEHRPEAMTSRLTCVSWSDS